MFHKVTWISLAVLVSAVFGAAAQDAGDSTAAKGREILQKNKTAVVTVMLVVKERFSMGGAGSNEYEMKMEATGTVIDPSGLTVLSLFRIDPSAMTEAMGEEDEGAKVTFEIVSTKILLDSGDEIDARVVLRDADLDLAFVRPVSSSPDKPFAYIDLSNQAQPQVLDQIAAINRLGKVARRTYAVCLDRIEAIVEKPRTIYIPSQTQSGNATLGCPAFAMDGKMIGIAVMRIAGGRDEMSMEQGFLAVIVPAADILDAAKQAPAAAQADAAKPEKAPEEKKAP